MVDSRPGVSTAPQRRGRPRSTAAHQAILRAASELLIGVGFDPTTVDAIAARAGVSKATIYRWWPNKAAVVMDAFLADTAPRMPFPHTGTTRTDLRHQMRAVIDLFNDPVVGRSFAGLIAEAQRDQALAAALRERFIDQRREAAREVIQRGINRGDLRRNVDPDLVIDTLYGALYYRFLVSGDPLPRTYADRLLDQFMSALQSPHRCDLQR
jgi:AcrR family transcriptional regulator